MQGVFYGIRFNSGIAYIQFVPKCHAASAHGFWSGCKQVQEMVVSKVDTKEALMLSSSIAPPVPGGDFSPEWIDKAQTEAANYQLLLKQKKIEEDIRAQREKEEAKNKKDETAGHQDEMMLPAVVITMLLLLRNVPLPLPRVAPHPSCPMSGKNSSQLPLARTAVLRMVPRMVLTMVLTVAVPKMMLAMALRMVPRMVLARAPRMVLTTGLM